MRLGYLLIILVIYYLILKMDLLINTKLLANIETKFLMKEAIKQVKKQFSFKGQAKTTAVSSSTTSQGFVL